MPTEGIKKREETSLVGGGEKANQPLRFIIKGFHAIGRRMGDRDQRCDRNKVPDPDRLRVRPGKVTPRTLITGVRVLGDVLRQSFAQPARNTIRIESVHDEVNDFVSKSVVGEFVLWIALNEQASLRMNSTRPLFQIPERLELLPILRVLKNVDVRFGIAGGVSRSSSFTTTR